MIELACCCYCHIDIAAWQEEVNLQIPIHLKVNIFMEVLPEEIKKGLGTKATSDDAKSLSLLFH